MHPLLRIVGIFFVFLFTLVGWLTLAGVTDARSRDSQSTLRDDVGSLWGNAQTQAAPGFQLQWPVEVTTKKDVTDALGNVVSTRAETHWETRTQNVDPASSTIGVDLHLDERRRGLLWFPLYDVAFDGTWTYEHREGVPRTLELSFAYPDRNADYDDLHFVVDGKDLARDLRATDGHTTSRMTVDPGQIVTLRVAYTSRGADRWTYQPSEGVGQLEAFALTMNTDFDNVDFTVPGRSPTAKEQATSGPGWTLHWDYARVVSGVGIGMIMPTHIQPGELATDLSVSAPLSLGLFFLWIYVLGLLKDRQVHPINYLFISGGFFSFNLLFAYTADRLPLEWAFALSAGVSVSLVTSYLRLVVGSRFALVEAGIAQLLYQVGFAAAHFADGLTGLTITVLGIVTLFALMQLTGRIEWSTVLGKKRVEPVKP